jgi:hypothetical protein
VKGGCSVAILSEASATRAIAQLCRTPRRSCSQRRRSTVRLRTTSPKRRLCAEMVDSTCQRCP